MNEPSLAALHILVTRPAPQQTELVTAIQDASGTALHLPLLEIGPLTELTNNALLIEQIQNLDNYHILIFVSANAVHFGMQWIERYWPQFPHCVELVAIGPRTAADLAVALHEPVSHAEIGAASEKLLELPVFHSIAGRRIGIFRGQGGRELLAQTLVERGASVDYLEVYTRKLVPYDSVDFVASLRAESINVLTVSSGESLQHLSAILGDNKAEMSLLPLLVPSPRVAEQAKAAGFRQVIDAGGADAASMMTALRQLAGQSSA